MDDTLRRQLKAISVNIHYKKEHSYEVNNAIYQIGETSFKSKNFQIYLQRIIQQ